MKIITIVTSLFIFCMTFALAQEHDHDKGEHSHHEMNDTLDEVNEGFIDPKGTLVSILVEGMVCDFCAQSIQKVFMKRDEVVGISVDLDNQKITLALKENTDIDNDVIEELFLDAGFNATEIMRKKVNS